MSTRRNVLRHLTAMPATAHPGLWYDRFVTEAAAAARGDTPAAKDTLINQLENHAVRPDSTYQRCYNLWKTNLSAVPDCEVFAATTLGRCLVGLGATSVLDAGLALHYTYGYPYIPGSALKGLSAAYARQYGGAAWSVESSAYLTLFGKQEESGVIDFLDAYWQPTQQSPFAADIMSVHQSEYYKNDNHAPSDRETMNIVGLLSVGNNQVFSIPLVGPEAWRRAAAKLLSEALIHMGIGAKTNAGYGRMQLEIPLTPEEQLAVHSEKVMQKANEYIDSVVKKIGPAQKGQIPAIVGKFLNDYKAGTYDTQSARLIAAAFRDKIKELQVSTANLWYPELQKIQ